jgi:hypothetical protein
MNTVRGEQSNRNPSLFRGTIRFRDGPGVPIRFTLQSRQVFVRL